MSQRLVGIKEGAEECGTSVATVRRMIKRGVLTGFRSAATQRSQIFIDPTELKALLTPQPFQVAS
jgi:hypothetical protein